MDALGYLTKLDCGHLFCAPRRYAAGSSASATSTQDHAGGNKRMRLQERACLRALGEGGTRTARGKLGLGAQDAVHLLN